MQVIAGPRQVGKTTLVGQVVEGADLPSVSASADDPGLKGRAWIDAQWNRARATAKASSRQAAILVLDEIHKVDGWSEAVKRLWDQDSASGIDLRVVLLGSAPIAVRRGLTDSRTGRFELIRLPHWSYPEMRSAFGWEIERYVLFGGYPGAAPLVDDVERWARYVSDALIETTIAREVLLVSRVDKPALLRRLFELACSCSGQILSYQKMLGQLLDAGNTTTLAHYLELLAAAGMVTGLQKYAGEEVRRRGSSPKLQALNTALVTAQAEAEPEALRRDTEAWGRLVESAVGAHLANAAAGGDLELFYWREANREVNFVVRIGRHVTAIEVKSGRNRGQLSGMDAFRRAFEPDCVLLVGDDGIPLEEFLSSPVSRWVGAEGP